MTTCDGCGEPIGHATGIEAEYHSENLDEKYYYFGDSECKYIFEDEHDVVEKVECEDCGETIKKSESIRGTKIVSGIQCKVRRCPDCAEEP